MICNHISCNRKEKYNGYCESHNAQIHRMGTTKHLLNMPNEYEIIGSDIFITLYDGHGDPKYNKVVIDKNDHDIIKDLRVSYSYTKTSERIKVKVGDGKQKMLSRILLNPPDDMLVDHKDQDIYNNRRSNLRICTKSQNNMNRIGTAGVWYHNQNKNWCAEIHINTKKIGLGSYGTKEEALKARYKAEKEIFKEFAPERK